jgi:3-oxo-4-pregnene-20-carboxyl-CoA dehydrogenase alpha subunit
MAAWQALAKAGLLALTLPGWLGGEGLGVLEAAVLLTEVGRRAADVPALATIMLGTLPVVRWGDRGLADRVLAGIGEGETILTAAVRERSSGMPGVPATIAVLDRTGAGTVTGTKVGVPFAGRASWILVPTAVAGRGNNAHAATRHGSVRERSIHTCPYAASSVSGAGRARDADPASGSCL